MNDLYLNVQFHKSVFSDENPEIVNVDPLPIFIHLGEQVGALFVLAEGVCDGL